MSRNRANADSLVTVDAPIRARFEQELPAIVAWREQRLLPGHRRWGIEALGYGVLTLVGLQFFDWPPILVFLHLVVTQWIGLLAEVLVLRRLAQRGVTRLLSAAQINSFVETLALVLRRAAQAGSAAAAPRIPRSLLPDVTTRDDTSKNAAPLELAGTLVFLGVLATGVLVGAAIYAEGSLREELLSQPVALACLGGSSLVQLATQFRHRLEPLLPGATWNVEFNPGLRVFGLVLLAMLSPAVVQDADEARGFAMFFYAAIAFWGAVTLATIGMVRRRTATLREWLPARAE